MFLLSSLNCQFLDSVQYVVVDFLWYRKKTIGAYTDSYGFDVFDEWGRMVPDPGRWPSSQGGKGFSQVAGKVHSMGLKFGIHVMRGLSLQAFNANTLILDTTTVLFFIQNQLNFLLSFIDVNIGISSPISLDWKCSFLGKFIPILSKCVDLR